MTTWFKTLIPSLALAFAVAGTGCESKSDKARKPGLVDTLVNNAVTLCDTSTIVAKHGAPYADRLHKILMECRTKDLALYKERNIVIALDRRLSKQSVSFLGSRLIEGVYYNNGADQQTLALWDDGRADTKIIGKSTITNSAEIISTLADELREQRIPPSTPIGIAGEYSYTTGSGNSRTTHYEIRWSSPENYAEKSVNKNEKILTASPRRGASAKW